MIITRIADGSPELHGPRAINLNQNGDAPHTPFSKNVLDVPYELSSDSLATPARMHHQAVHVAPPSVEGPKQCPYDLILGQGEYKDCRRVVHHATQLLDVIGWTHARARFLPEPKNQFRVT